MTDKTQAETRSEGNTVDLSYIYKYLEDAAKCMDILINDSLEEKGMTESEVLHKACELMRAAENNLHPNYVCACIKEGTVPIEDEILTQEFLEELSNQ